MVISTIKEKHSSYDYDAFTATDLETRVSNLDAYATTVLHDICPAIYGFDFKEYQKITCHMLQRAVDGKVVQKYGAFYALILPESSPDDLIQNHKEIVLVEIDLDPNREEGKLFFGVTRCAEEEK